MFIKITVVYLYSTKQIENMKKVLENIAVAFLFMLTMSTMAILLIEILG